MTQPYLFPDLAEFHLVRVDMTPRGKERAGRGKNGTFYTPRQTVKVETQITFAWKNQVGRQAYPAHVPVVFILEVNFERPLSARKGKAFRKYPTVKPDWDNIGKLVADALNTVAYHDDCQVVEAHIYKRYVNEPPFVRFWTEEKTD